LNASEHEEQKALIEWADYQRFNGEPIGKYLYAIPNAGDRHPAVGAKMKAEGLRAGFPDLGLAIPVGHWHGLFIEMKAVGGRLRPNQRDWLERLQGMGYKTACCPGFDLARIEIERYLALAGRLYLNGSAH
jgi:hypothetical protein